MEGSSRLLKRIVNQMIFEPEPKIPLQSQDFKALRTRIKTCEQEIETFVGHLYESVQISNPVVRTATLLVFDYFFQRSHVFRLCTLERIQDLLRFTCETDPLHYPMPPPREEAKGLKIAAIKILKVWNDKYNAGYPQLAFTTNFLQSCKSVDFEQASAEVLAEKQQKERQELKLNEKHAKIIAVVMNKFEEVKADIHRCFNEVDSALHILVPSFDDLETVDPSFTVSDAEETERLHGCSQQTISVIIKPDSPRVEVSKENEAVVQAVKDARIMLGKYVGMISSWLKKLAECGATEDKIKLLIDAKKKLSNGCSKVDELRLVSIPTSKEADSDDSEDSDFEDVPEKELEEFEIPYEVPEYLMKAVAKDVTDMPCCSKSLSENVERDKKQVPQMGNNLPSVPIVDFGLDLKYWGEERGVVQMPKNNFDGHRFWRVPEDEISGSAAVVQPSVYETRMITYVGEEIRPKRECRARLKDGQLCPRRDKTKCPIHGVIIDRDEEGFPVKETPVSEVAATVQDNMLGDEEFIRDLEAATGKNLSGAKQKKTKKRHEKVHEGRQIRERLEKKLLDKRTMKRVGATLDAIHRAKVEKKFAGQFNYSLTR